MASRQRKSKTTKFKNRREERNNFQDSAMEREYNKGFRAGKFPSPKVNPTMNDPQWYFKQEQILNDVASFSFSTPLGSRIPYENIFSLNPTANHPMVYSSWSAAVPGLLALAIAPVPGVATDSQSPVNLAATNVYSYVRYKNSGATNYDSPDLMMYLLTMDSLFACWNWMKRLYGMASTYSQTNRYMPQAWFAANNVDLEDLLMHLADFRAFLNMKANEIAAFCVPATMTYHVRHSWLFANVYKDSDTDKAQQYMYVPAFFYQYQEATAESGGQLTPKSILWESSLNAARTPLTTQDLINYLNELVEAANYSEDIGVMSGDILKAYGEGNLFTLSLIPDDYRVEPVFSKEVLTQIENARCIPYMYNGGSLNGFNVTQDPNTNWIKFQPTLKNTNVFGAEARGDFLNFHWQSPTPKDVIVASRLKATYDFVESSESSGTFNWYLTSCGSEVLLYSSLYFFAYSDNAAAGVLSIATRKLVLQRYDLGTNISIDTQPESSWSQARVIVTAAAAIQLLSAFDWHPMIWVSCIVDSAAGGGR